MSKLNKMKDQSELGYCGICCKLTEENEELLIEEGFSQWGVSLSEDGSNIYAIDSEDVDMEFIPLPDDGEYREFEFIDGIPVFKD